MPQHRTPPEKTLNSLEQPRMMNGKPLLLVGFRERYSAATVNHIPALWARFAPHIGNIPGQVGDVAYGVGINMCSGDDQFDYLAGVEVSDFALVPAEFARLNIPAQNYAVFPHHGHVSTLKDTVHAILHEWLPRHARPSSNRSSNEPDFFERYGEEFNPQTGLGGIEVWLVVR